MQGEYYDREENERKVWLLLPDEVPKNRQGIWADAMRLRMISVFLNSHGVLRLRS